MCHRLHVSHEHGERDKEVGARVSGECQDDYEWHEHAEVHLMAGFFLHEVVVKVGRRPPDEAFVEIIAFLQRIPPRIDSRINKKN